jgi:hypothetical protein
LKTVINDIYEISATNIKMNFDDESSRISEDELAQILFSQFNEQTQLLLLQLNEQNVLTIQTTSTSNKQIIEIRKAPLKKICN